MGGPSSNRPGHFMYRSKSAFTALQHHRRVLRSPPEVPPPSTGRFRPFGLSTLALAIMPRRVLSAMGGPSSNRPGHFMYRPKSAFTALQHHNRVLRSPPEVPPPSTGRFRHFGLSTLALAIMTRRVLSAMGGPSSNRPGHFMYRSKSASTSRSHRRSLTPPP